MPTSSRDLALIVCATVVTVTAIVCLAFLVSRGRIDGNEALLTLAAMANLGSFALGRLSGAPATPPS